jgi:hypothetical protein
MVTIGENSSVVVDTKFVTKTTFVIGQAKANSAVKIAVSKTIVP